MKNERPITDFLTTITTLMNEVRIEQASASIYQEKLMLERQMKCLEMIKELAVAVLWTNRPDARDNDD